MIQILKRLIPKAIKRYYWRYKKKQERLQKKRMKFDGQTPKETFTRIHDTNYWSGRDSISGGGSDLQHTQILIQELNSLIKEKQFKSILDIPCGDFVWMQYVDLRGVKYVGGDIVDELIANNDKNYKDRTNVDFKVLDLLSDSLPTADVLLVRDCLVHLSNTDIMKALKNIQNSKCTYLLSTTFPNHQTNKDITTGDWRVLNLERPPFNFPKPQALLNEGFKHDQYHDKSLGLWKISELTELISDLKPD